MNGVKKMPEIYNKEVIEFLASHYVTYLYFERFKQDKEKVDEALSHYLTGLLDVTNPHLDCDVLKIEVLIDVIKEKCLFKFKEEN